MSRWSVAYVIGVPALMLVATADPNDIRRGPFVAAIVLTLPAFVGVLPFLYVVLATVWNVTGADDGGPGWVVTLSYVVVFGAIAAANVAVIGTLRAMRRAPRPT